MAFVLLSTSLLSVLKKVLSVLKKVSDVSDVSILQHLITKEESGG